MASQLETIRIKAAGPQGYMTINKADFDPKKHQLWSEPKKPEGDGK